MSTIRIEGVSNTSVLRAGEIVEVERTVRIDRLIERGYVRELPTNRIEAPGFGLVAAGGWVAPAEVTVDPQPVDKPVPARNAKTEVWLDYVRGLGIEEPDDATREKLLADYDEYQVALNG